MLGFIVKELSSLKSLGNLTLENIRFEEIKTSHSPTYLSAHCPVSANIFIDILPNTVLINWSKNLCLSSIQPGYPGIYDCKNELQQTLVGYTFGQVLAPARPFPNYTVYYLMWDTEPFPNYTVYYLMWDTEPFPNYTVHNLMSDTEPFHN